MNYKAGYWVALAIFAVAFNSEYKQGSFPALHQAADRVEQEFCHFVSHAEQTLAFARMMVKDDQPVLLASNQFDVQQQMQLAREQAQAAREMAREQVRAQQEAIRQQTRDQMEATRDQIRSQMESIRAQAGIHRVEMEHVREQIRTQMRTIRENNRHLRVTCPQTGSTVVMDSDSLPSDDETGPF
jgi:hypothetical protein